MPLDRTKCVAKKVWCGKGPIPHGDAYSRQGTSFECLQQGFGAGKYSEKEKHLPFDSLQRIKYVGETHEASFKKQRISNLGDLERLSKRRPRDLEKVLEKVLTKKDGKIDTRAFNHVLMWLEDQGAKITLECIEE